MMKMLSLLTLPKKLTIFPLSALSLGLMTGLSPSIAQIPHRDDNPNQERFPQTSPSLQPLSPEKPPLPIQPPSDQTPTLTPPPETAPSEKIHVEKIRVKGSTAFTAKTFEPIIKPIEGHLVTLEELNKVADAITQLYLNHGYITSRAVLTDQKITNGIVEIQVIEGGLEKIEIQGTRKLSPSYVRSRIAIGASKPLSTAKLEEQLKLLRADPLFANVEASLRPGTGLGQSILIVRVVEANPLSGDLSIDNYSPPSVGSERLGVNTSDRNLTGRGDQLNLSYYHSLTGGSNIYDFSYIIPLNPMNGTFQLRTAINQNKVTDSTFQTLDIHGESYLYEASYRQPLLRSLRQEFALSLGFTYQDGQTFTFAGPTPFGAGPDAQGNSRTRVLKFGQEYVRRDFAGAWALRSLFSVGLGILNATSNSSPVPDGQFFSWLGQLQRVQRLGQDNLLIAQAELQLTPDALLPSQQYVLGGGESLRGYRQNLSSSDNGAKFSLEDRITLEKDSAGTTLLQVAPFVDLGYVWNVPTDPNPLQNQHFLAGAGMGLLVQIIPRLNVRLDWALPIINVSDRGTNAQDDGFYFSANYHL
jgi:hemolysin activation/secretion protein